MLPMMPSRSSENSPTSACADWSQPSSVFPTYADEALADGARGALGAVAAPANFVENAQEAFVRVHERPRIHQPGGHEQREELQQQAGVEPLARLDARPKAPRKLLEDLAPAVGRLLLPLGLAVREVQQQRDVVRLLERHFGDAGVSEQRGEGAARGAAKRRELREERAERRELREEQLSAESSERSKNAGSSRAQGGATPTHP